MKLFLLFLFFTPLSIFAQKDFDYTVFTTKSVQIKSHGEVSDTLNLTLSRKFEKQSNVLKAISTTNTADVVEYKLEYQGASFQTGCPVLMYRILKVNGEDFEKMFIFINPIDPTLIFKSDSSSLLFH
jgi:hypothetical protein